MAALCSLSTGTELLKVSSTVCHQDVEDTDNIYNYAEKNIHENQTIDLSFYRGKAVLIVNVATY